MPVVEAARVHAEELREETQHHEAHDMVGVAVVEDGLHAFPHAAHLGPTVPEEGRHVPVLAVERVLLDVVRHEVPVDAAHELAPAHDLPDEALDAVEGRLALLVGRDCSGHALARVEELRLIARPIIEQAKSHLKDPGQLVIEIAACQKQQVMDLATAAGLRHPSVLTDHEKLPRVLVADA